MVAALFTLAAVGSALRKPVTEGFDEMAHLSYVATLQSMPESNQVFVKHIVRIIIAATAYPADH